LAPSRLGVSKIQIRLIENRRRLRQVVGVKFANYFACVLAALLSVSCSKSETPAAPAALTLDDILPKHAQPKLPTMKIYLGAETLDAELALTEQQEMTGMMFRTNIQDSDAMIFVLPQPQRANFWMKNCPESISAAYITTDGTIQEIHHLEKNDTNGVVAARDDIRFVLETQDGWFDHHHIATGTVMRTEKGTLVETFLSGRQ
jgi:uncharacterized membrane protein (UPF0127 family)